MAPVDSATHGGSRPGRRCNIKRKRAEGYKNLWDDYFADEPIFGPAGFRRRYRMRGALFVRIIDTIAAYDPYFIQTRDATSLLDLSTIQKYTCAMWLLAYGVSYDSTEESLRLAESTTMKCLYRFVQAVRACFEYMYLRKPTQSDILEQMDVNESRGWLGMFASLDYMHYKWKNCPVGL
jgi:hypothetical protein